MKRDVGVDRVRSGPTVTPGRSLPQTSTAVKMTTMPTSRSTSTRYRLVRALPLLVIAASAVTDLCTPTQERYDAFLFIVPGLAAVAWGAVATMAFGVVGALVNTGLDAARGEPFLPAGLAGLVLMMVFSAVAAWTSTERQRYELEARRMREVAEVTQRAMQHPLPNRLGRLDLYLLYETSVAGAHVGGDFYKALHVPGKVRVMIGDVQGKGLGAVETAAVLLASFRESAYSEPDLPGVARRLQTSMERYSSRGDTTMADRFATVLLAEIPDDLPVVRLLSCGHPPPVRRHDGRTEYVSFREPSLPVNLPVAVDEEHVVEEVRFEAGDRLLLYTDGVSETRDDSGAFYPLDERLAAWATEPDERIPALLSGDLHRFSRHGLDDDTAAVLIAHR
ncbi:PP2C family protein-serine/threonine phosphatase [Streptomyces sp. NPDC057939]|uniref:PP2C family protein-serine/threonine phosphatase n=1 Tax=Streptomyces sp. NPDC057939 TaxID=3346284 RepID=UPI0036E0EFDC